MHYILANIDEMMMPAPTLEWIHRKRQGIGLKKGEKKKADQKENEQKHTG